MAKSEAKQKVIKPLPEYVEGMKFAPGIYFGVPDHVYHADSSLGSSSKKELLGDPCAYWWDSPLNPVRDEESDDTPAKMMGRAVHKFVLEGRDAFTKRYGRCVHKGNVKAGIEERAVLHTEGREPLAAKHYDRASAAATMIRSNPYIAGAFSDAATEVSLFWETEVDGEIVREKARFDALKIRAVSDLKTHSPMDGLVFSTSCHRAIKTYKMHIQAASYLQGRGKIAQMVKAGQVYGQHDPEWLGRVAEAKDFAFVLCFWASTGAPLSWGTILSPQNPKIIEGEEAVARALLRYVEFRREFGESVAWIRPEPLLEADPEFIDNWFYRDGR